MTNFEWDKKECVSDAESGRKCDSDSTKKRARKMRNADVERRAFTSY
jgi:hypothetical protein